MKFDKLSAQVRGLWVGACIIATQELSTTVSQQVVLYIEGALHIKVNLTRLITNEWPVRTS